MPVIPYIRGNDGSTSGFAKGRPFQVASDHPRYDDIFAAINAGDEDGLLAIVEPPPFKAEEIRKAEQLASGKIVYDPFLRQASWADGTPIHHVLVSRAAALRDAGNAFEHLLRFLDRLYSNPSKRAVDELYAFLEHNNIPITDDGCFLGYKRVRPPVDGRYFDHHTGRFEYAVGVEARVPRNTVDDTWANACSSGLHVGSVEYVRSFHAGSPIMVVKGDPADVVSVPSNEVNKLRTCALTPVCFMDEKDLGVAYSRPVYSASPGSTPTPVAGDGPPPRPAQAGPPPAVPALVLGLVPGSAPADWRQFGEGWVHRDGWTTAAADNADLMAGEVSLDGSWNGDAADVHYDAPDATIEDIQRSPLWRVSGVSGEGYEVCWGGGDWIAVGCHWKRYRDWADPGVQRAEAEEHGLDADDLDAVRRAVNAVAAANNIR